MPAEFGCKNIEKKFINRLIFRDININLKIGSALAVKGRNGSGKSTLLKILANLIKETSGEIYFKIDGKELQREKFYRHMGFVAPYLSLYDELTAYENINFFLKLKNNFSNPEDIINPLLEKVNLYTRRNDAVKHYSSGMKQRLRFAFAVINQPSLLILDEPGTNLDEDGMRLVYGIMEEYKYKGILIIAANDKEDAALCNISINIENYKPGKQQIKFN
ncbi:MAG: ABC transporter ATP-binding protein [Ignavibacteria bacterium]|nr:ABC transporter ATP-binding protein [Ignavibacteria bacterium]